MLPPERARGEDNGRQDLLALLKAEQDRAGYVSRQAMAGIALNTGTTLSEVFGVASFYSFLYTRPKGRNVIRVCKSVPCYLKDAPMIIATVQETLGISPGQSTPDGRFAFELVHCIGACDQAPAMLINDTLYANLTPERIAGILTSYEEEGGFEKV